MPAKTIILNIKNNTAYTNRISILGGLSDTNRNNVNAVTEYLFDIALPQGVNPPANWAASTGFTLQYRNVGSSIWLIASGQTYGDFRKFVIELNNLNLGIFNVAYANSTLEAIVTYNDVLEFGDLVIL
jgi:hypothetical protein